LLVVNNVSPTPSLSMGNNTLRNNILTNWGDLSTTYRWMPFYSWSVADFQTVTYDHNLNWGYGMLNGGTNQFGVLYNTAGQSAEVPYDCTTASSLFTTGSASNCGAADPKFVAAWQSYSYSSPGAYNLRLQATSPAIGAASTSAPLFDLTGILRAVPASLGAYEGSLGTAGGAFSGGRLTIGGGVRR
jgi:hypothetical protein